MAENSGEAPVSLTPKPRPNRLAVGGLIVLAACVFGLGINWGLPSHVIDPILFGSGSTSATTALNSYHLTGVGIDRLAGSWDENAGLAADVAAHPIGDRSKPVTLLENPYVATENDPTLVNNDDRFSTLKALASQSEAKYAQLRIGGDEKAADAASKAALKAQEKVHAYLQEYNRQHFGDVTAVQAQDDVTRARILRRYRLYSFQPDEMITFRALAMMHPGKGQFDPKLYQYGGLWIYPVGAILKAASMVGYVTATNDTTYYLDSPDAFGRFYILARAYSAAWGIVGALAVFAIMRRANAGMALSALAAVGFICLPVVVDLAHEAKPHLAACSLMLLAVLAAQNYVETGKWKWAIVTGIACGASAGMILWGAASLWILVMMAVWRKTNIGKGITVFVAGAIIAAVIYFATNPYVAIHLLEDRTILGSNFGNSEAMYGLRPDIVNSLRLIAIGISWPIATAGVVGAIRLFRKGEWSLWSLMAMPAIVILLEFFQHSGGKPGEYARFAIFADVALMLAAFLAISRFSKGQARIAAALILVAAAAIYSFSYERGFIRDSSDSNSRMDAAAAIDLMRTGGERTSTLYLTAEPAPYCLPPVNLFHWKIVLLPVGGTVPSDAAGGVKVAAKDSFGLFDFSASPISWANKSFDVVEIAGK